MAIIKSQIDPNSGEFAANDAHMRELVADLQTHLEQVEKGGGEKACEKHTKRGKMLPRERVKNLIDPSLLLVFYPFHHFSWQPAAFEAKFELSVLLFA